jgi:hypothetical protein
MDNSENRTENYFGMTASEAKEKSEQRYNSLLQKLETLHPKIVSDFKNVPDKHKRLYLEVHAGEKVSVAKRVKQKCMDCCCWDRTEITNCTVRQCGLWAIRPYQQ